MNAWLTDSRRGENESSVVVGAARWRAAFVAIFFVLLAIKCVLAATLSPFGDEAFYWQESRHLAWGYSDLPPMTAWLIRFGETLAGHGLLGMRWPFLAIGSALPWIVVGFARRAFDATTGWQAGLLCLAMPLTGSLGLLALPDVPLTVACMFAVYRLIVAVDENRPRDWAGLGFAVAVAWMTHYRAAMLVLACLMFALLTPRGRQLWSRPGLWLAIVLGGLGLIPLVISNGKQHGAGIAFQLVQRNPWRFHADALVQPLEQALACTPLLYGLLLWVAWCSGKRLRIGAPWDVIATTSITYILVYFFAGLFADDTRFRAHWPLPGYLPLIAALPVMLREHLSRNMRRLRWAAFALAGVGQLACMTYAGLAAYPDGANVLAGMKAFPANFVGWRQSAQATTSLLAEHPSAVLVADNFMLAAELDFAFDGARTIYVLDSPLNAKHGRAPQLAIWSRDERGLRAAHAGAPTLLVVDELALRERERVDWLSSICARIHEVSGLRRLDIYDGRKRFAFYQGVVPAEGDQGREDASQCIVWLDAWKAANAHDSGQRDAGVAQQTR